MIKFRSKTLNVFLDETYCINSKEKDDKYYSYGIRIDSAKGSIRSTTYGI